MPAYGAPAATPPDRMPWPRVFVRMLLVVLPAQLIGNFAASIALVASGMLRDRPGLAVLMIVVGGLLAGVGIGVAMRPDHAHLIAYAAAGAAVAIVTFVLVLGLAQLRLPDGATAASVGSYLRGALIVAAVQSAVAVPLWLLRARRT